jgi:SAM-dependent methyltransferase
MSSANAAGLAFDALAPTYDQDFTYTHIGRAQRNAVLASAFGTFAGRQRILELNCGTGKDASRFASAGWCVLALDASEQMICVASNRDATLQASGHLRFQRLATEELASLGDSFDGVFSNFSGLNCVHNLNAVAEDLAALTTHGSPLVLCFSTRFCLWETLWYTLTLKPKKAARRWSGTSNANIRGRTLTVHYPRIAQIRAAFAARFMLEHVQAIGLLVPPSYIERYVARFPSLLHAAAFIDSLISRLPFLRVIGDHMLLTLRKTEGTT